MTTEHYQPKTADETSVLNLYQQLLNFWNERNAQGYVSLFTKTANVIGFDGSPMNGRSEIETSLKQIFNDHLTSTYVGKVREIRNEGETIMILRAVAGMVPRGKSDIKPDVNAIQSLVAAKHDGRWKIVLFQNTPAQFHGRPGLAEQLTEELRELLHPATESRKN
jgi:uncharacterized protein (TIGR02246 family)